MSTTEDKFTRALIIALASLAVVGAALLALGLYVAGHFINKLW